MSTRTLLPLLAALALLAAPARPAAQEGGLHLAGTVFTADGGSPEGLRVRVRVGERRDSTVVDAGGRFSLLLPAPPAGAHLEVVVDAAVPALRRYLPAWLALRPAAAEREQRIVLLPRRWPLRHGVHAPDTVEIRPELAFEPACRGCSSYYHPATTNAVEREPAGIQTWPAAVFPIRLAFDRGVSRTRVAPRDSTRFWEIAGEMERGFGRDLFRPAGFLQAARAGAEAPEDALLLSFEAVRHGSGWGSTVAQKGDIFFGAVRLRAPAEMYAPDGPSLVMHELLHALGHGHTCAWRSVMADARRCPDRRAPAPTPEDVAYAELLWTVREMERVLGARGSVEAALSGAGVP